VVDPLLRRGADPNVVNYQRRAALHVAAAAQALTKELVALLVAFGADVSAVCLNGHTPLTLALRHGVAPAVLAALLASRADVNYVQSKDQAWRGHSPPTVALRSGRGPDVVRMLLDAGASPAVVLEDG